MAESYRGKVPPTSIVGQPPEGDRLLSLEVMTSDRSEHSGFIKRKTCGEMDYICVEHSGIREVIAAGLTSPSLDEGAEKQSRRAFEMMKAILEQEKLTFSDVVRQWNFIEGIVDSNTLTDLRQNYQIFNDIRSEYYRNDSFDRGFPAATGIGMNTGGIVLEFIALSRTGQTQIVPIDNPLQINAHRYSQGVLVGESLAGGDKTTPKFERAKATIHCGNGILYISGTAAIVGEKTITENSAVSQTETTIKNILALISRENLKKHGLPVANEPGPLSYLRAYVKEEKELAAVKAMCNRYFKDTMSLYVVSDICRNELLVELEGAVDITLI